MFLVAAGIASVVCITLATGLVAGAWKGLAYARTRWTR